MSNRVKFHPKQLSKLQEVFPKQEITPASTTHDIYYQAGIAKVLSYIASNTDNTYQQNINPITIGEIADG